MDAWLLLLCLFWFFNTKPRDWLGRTSMKWPVLCQVGRKTLTQSHFSSVITCCGCIFTHATLCKRGTCSHRVSVRPSCLSQVTVLQRWLNLGSCKQRHTIALVLWFFDVKDLGKLTTGSVNPALANRRFTNWRSKVHGKMQLG